MTDATSQNDKQFKMYTMKTQSKVHKSQRVGAQRQQYKVRYIKYMFLFHTFVDLPKRGFIILAKNSKQNAVQPT